MKITPFLVSALCLSLPPTLESRDTVSRWLKHIPLLVNDTLSLTSTWTVNLLTPPKAKLSCWGRNREKNTQRQKRPSFVSLFEWMSERERKTGGKTLLGNLFHGSISSPVRSWAVSADLPLPFSLSPFQFMGSDSSFLQHYYLWRVKPHTQTHAHTHTHTDVHMQHAWMHMQTDDNPSTHGAGSPSQIAWGKHTYINTETQTNALTGARTQPPACMWSAGITNAAAGSSVRRITRRYRAQHCLEPPVRVIGNCHWDRAGEALGKDWENHSADAPGNKYL